MVDAQTAPCFSAGALVTAHSPMCHSPIATPPLPLAPLQLRSPAYRVDAQTAGGATPLHRAAHQAILPYNSILLYCYICIHLLDYTTIRLYYT